jgi:hypothetical protein
VAAVSPSEFWLPRIVTVWPGWRSPTLPALDWVTLVEPPVVTLTMSPWASVT